MSLNIPEITSINLNTIQYVLASDKISDRQKIRFVNQNKAEIHHALSVEISPSEFRFVMQNRPLRKFKPIKNSLTKRGDKILLAKALGIEPVEVDDYIENVEEQLGKTEKLSFLSKDKTDAIKTYVYRHGSTDGITAMLNYELKSSNDLLNTLYRTLEYHTGGIADYFIRPIHKMSNKTLIRLYNVIDDNIKEAQKSGSISKEESEEVSRWALIRIYQIQNNSSFINAVKTLKVLNG